MQRTDILIRSGNYFDFLQPEQRKFTIEDIAYALSNICRFGGHTKEFYSVAQHSVLASHIVSDPFDKFPALMHDAAEAFIGDVTKPLKNLLPDLQAIEKRVEKAVFDQFGITMPLPKSVKIADLVLLATEQRDLMPFHDDTWPSIADVTPLAMTIEPLGPQEAYDVFMQRYHELVSDRNLMLSETFCRAVA